MFVYTYVEFICTFYCSKELENAAVRHHCSAIITQPFALMKVKSSVNPPEILLPFKRIDKI